MKRAIYIKLIISAVIIIVGIWYFALKDYNYKISFTSTQAPGIIYSNLLRWNYGKDPNAEVVTTVSQIPFSEIQQEVTVSDSVFRYHWIIKRKNDSLTKVTALVKDQKNSFWQNLQALFRKNAFVKQNISSVKKVGEGLVEHMTYYKVSPVRKTNIPSTYCAYITLTAPVRDKGNTMVKNIYLLTDYIKTHNIPLIGDPFLEITQWDIDQEMIAFNFCFPIKEQATYPKTNSIKFKKTKEKKALKTIFNGNYAISDRAWYVLIDYAKTNNIAVENLPVEVYLDDPHAGGDEMQWEAAVYLPIKN